MKQYQEKRAKFLKLLKAPSAFKNGKKRHRPFFFFFFLIINFSNITSKSSIKSYITGRWPKGLLITGTIDYFSLLQFGSFSKPLLKSSNSILLFLELILSGMGFFPLIFPIPLFFYLFQIGMTSFPNQITYLHTIANFPSMPIR